MKIVIDIPEERYKDIQRIAWVQLEYHHFKTAEQIITNGTPLSKGHGRLIDADKCIRQAWNDFYKHEDEWEKKDPDYVGVKRFHDQNGFECCLKTIGNSPTIIEADKAESEDKLDGDPIDTDKAIEHYEGTLEALKGIDLEDKKMTREEIIKSALKFLVLKQTEQGSWGFSDRNENEISWDKVLEWLDQQPCGDCISRTELLKKQQIIIDEHGLAHKIVHIGKIIDAPSVEPERKPCYWTHDKDGWKCGACHNTIRDDDFPTCMGAPIYNYCPLCGEDMRGV